MTVMKASSSVTSRKHSHERRSHQTSAKLRRLYPRPGCSLPTKSSSSERTPGVTLPSRPWAGAQEAVTTSAALEQTTDLPTSILPGSLVQAEEVESSISLYSGQKTPTSIVITQPASTQSRGGCDHMAIPIDDADPLPADHKRHLLPNPYNRLNQRCHSTLHCPCCFFLCLLCCLPAVYFMVLSDLEFDFGSLLKARRYGRRTTKLYFAGATLAVTLLVTCVVCVTFFLPHTLVGP
ncbi:uncharacterized protein LOC112564077 [Pomacea canaliculata]|nr:uncharacterized protein LOC112564077 [Pomacea canaliculata]